MRSGDDYWGLIATIPPSEKVIAMAARHRSRVGGCTDSATLTMQMGMQPLTHASVRQPRCSLSALPSNSFFPLFYLSLISTTSSLLFSSAWNSFASGPLLIHFSFLIASGHVCLFPFVVILCKSKFFFWFPFHLYFFFCSKFICFRASFC